MHVVLGTGPLGRSVIKELRRREEPFQVVNFSGRQLGSEDILVVRADLMDSDQAKAAITGASVVYQCTQPPYHQWEGRFERLQENIIVAAMASGAKLVAAENVYMYGDVDDEMHEGLPYAARTKKGRIRAKLAEQLLELHHRGKLQAVVGRGSDFFGPGVTDSSAGERMFQPLIMGKAASVIGEPGRKHTFTFIEDFGRALVTLGQSEDAYGEAWHVPNADAVSVAEFVELAAQLAGVEARIKPMGKGMLRIGGLFIPAARECIEMFYQFEKEFVVSSKKFSDRFGQRATPLKESLAATVDWYRARRSLVG
ncbi:nucleoside-diphosphate-sugar epimerase [Paenibacillus castaneae]|uniref:NAD-dependent epimerase/dehydratase family protein n=1 Tax=Paenibacillus castaneae TaxID=474957 RepID=UPI000C9BFD22|nr:NAD-dependent epimerase/dehydratase family protein [Paenibacillus castaneae]NIK80460.1 nucleoside-diphosphate-sugar epimerase [Paenibacillus castaneae]